MKKNILQRFTNRKKSCAKVLNYFASPSIQKKLHLHGKKKRTKIKKWQTNASY
jgi:hypothetical protein